MARKRYSIRRLAKNDANELRALRLFALKESPASFGISYKEEKAKSLQETKKDILKDIILSAFDDEGHMIAVACCHGNVLEKLAHKAHIYGIYVKPEWRSRGIMNCLLRQILRKAQRKHSVMLASITMGNEIALSCFTKLGFEIHFTEKHALREGRTWYDLLHVRLDKIPAQKD